jgi:hypothetical protein
MNDHRFASRVRLSGTIQVPLPVGTAFLLFTPNGERTWAHGWDPRFPDPAADETAPGTVFETSHGGRESTWIVVRCEPGCSIEYATATPGQRCGLVSVVCEPSGIRGPEGGATTATVSYDLTALSPAAQLELDGFAKDYLSFLEHWEQAIAEAVSR